MRLHHLDEAGVLGEEAVAGMDRVRAGDAGGRQDGGNVEVAVLGRRRADADAFLGQADMHGLGIGGGVHGDGRNAQLAAGALDAKRDLAAVGDEDLLEQDESALSSRIISTSPYSTGAPLATSTRATVPAFGALIWLKVFIASISSSVCPAATVCPTVTNGGEPGSGSR